MTGRYRLVESIGQGGMGRVWRAADEMLDRQVAVKEMRIDGLDPEDTRTRRERTLREARATARIDHPNVVRVYDVVDQGERLWIVMELVAGRSLEQITVEEGPLGPRETARIGLGLVHALQQVHARGVLHRDIKPGNVLVENGGTGGNGVQRVVLTDFGIAAIQDAKALTMVGMLVGSPDYMAPERISGHPQGPPSDVWSLGATLCAALAGHSPFSRDTTLATLHAVLYEEPELPASVGPLREILAALLEKEPTTRPSLSDVASALEPVAFPPPTPTVAVGAGEAVACVAGTGTEGESEVEVEAEGREEVGERDGAGAGTGTGTEGRESTDVRQQIGDTPTPPLPWAVRRESATPAFLEHPAALGPRPPEPSAQLDPQPVDPRRPGPYDTAAGQAEVQDALPTQPDPAPAPAPYVTESAPERGSRVGLEMRSEAGAEETQSPGAGSAGGTPRRAGVSLTRAQAVTERRPAPDDPHAAPGHRPRPDAATHRAGLPPGADLPGRPAVPPPASRRTRRGAGRRTAVLAAAGVATAGVVIVIVLATAPGSHDNEGAGSTPSPSAVASSPSPSPTPTPTPTTAGPSPTVEGTSRPRNLPPGAHQEAGGFAWATPKGWRRDVKTGAEVHYTSPDGTQELVAKSSLARGDLMETWETSEQSARQGEDYRKIRLEETTFRGNQAVIWEYTFTLQGTRWHARLLGFNEDGKSYQINTWYQPEVEAAALRTYEQVKESFTVL